MMVFSTQDIEHMQRALRQAELAEAQGEVPIGAVLVLSDGMSFAAGNQTRRLADPCGHAEIVVMREAGRYCQNHRLLASRLYVTLEPCAMCAGAIVQARVANVIYGAEDARAGACGSALSVIPNKVLNHHPKVSGGLLAEQSRQLLTDFFSQRRG
jgi:tRNA(adenine34) deaminase